MPRLDPHLLRVPRRRAAAAPAPGWSTGCAGASALAEALDFWERRLQRRGRRPGARRRRSASSPTRRGSSSRFAADDVRRPAAAPPRPTASRPSTRCWASPASARTARDREASVPLFEARSGFERAAMTAGEYARWQSARAHLRLRRRRRSARDPGRGTVHHIAWCARDDAEHAAWRERRGRRGARPTPIIDRQYFHSVYFREPRRRAVRAGHARGRASTIDEPRRAPRRGAAAAAAARARCASTSRRR